MSRKNFTKEKKIQIALEYRNGSSSVQLGTKYKTCHHTILKIVRSFGFKIRSQSEAIRKYFLNENYFLEPLDEERAYWLDFLIADGSVTGGSPSWKLSIILHSQDIGHLKKFRFALRDEHPIRKITNKEAHRIEISSKKLVQSLKDFEIFQNKVHRFSFPEKIPESLYSAFLRDQWDGDGSLGTYLNKSNKSKYKYRHLFCNTLGPYYFLERVGEILYQQLQVHKSTIFSQKSTFCIRWGARQEVIRIIDFLYTDATIYLDRKYEHAMQILRRYPLQQSFLTSLL